MSWNSILTRCLKESFSNSDSIYHPLEIKEIYTDAHSSSNSSSKFLLFLRIFIGTDFLLRIRGCFKLISVPNIKFIETSLTES